MRKVGIILLGLLSLCSCAKTGSTNMDDEIKFQIGFPETKVTMNVFDPGDALSLYAVEWDGETQIPLQVSGNFINNEKLVFNGTEWSPVARMLYWSTEPCDFYALFPFQEQIESVSRYPFNLPEDQNGGGYEAADLLFASAKKISRADGPVSLQFRHMMSKLVVRLVKGEKFEGEIPDDVVVHVYNTITSCLVDLEKGGLEKESFGRKKTLTMKKRQNDTFEAIIVPQHIEKRTPLIEISMGGIAYLLETSLSFRPGCVHTITITLNTSPDQEQIEIDINPGIDPW